MIEKRPKDAKPYQFPKKCPCPLHTDVVREDDGDRRGGRARPLHRRVRLPVSEDRASETFVLAPRLRHRGAGREADRVLLRKRLGEGAGRHFHAAKRATTRSSSRRSKASARRRCAICSTPSRRGARLRSTVSSMRSASAMSARRPRALARGYGSWQAFHDACLKVAKGDEEAAADMDALDQIGDTVIDSARRPISAKATTAASSSG